MQVFGAYGWAEGSPAMKWLIDHLLVRGSTILSPTPSPRGFQTPDCPPHFYAGGKNPQFADFGVLMRMPTRVSHLFDGSQAYSPNAAILYHGEAEWAGGEYMLVQEPAKLLYDAHIDYDIVPIDSVCGQAVVDRGRLRIGNGCFDCLLVPRAQYVAHRHFWSRLGNWLARRPKSGFSMPCRRRKGSQCRLGETEGLVGHHENRRVRGCGG
ncbi:MAG: hypothetical protein ACLR23_10285 [Clostridia bacterium]